MAEVVGPKIGDAASLWNFTPSPGWTRDEVHALKICLMKFGVGRWVQIVDSGVLPGKLIQQLNGQTQRLLGQQSLAAFTGLHVDVDKVRADNEQRTDVTRKSGLIINQGGKLSKEELQRLRAEVTTKYGLTQSEVSAIKLPAPVKSLHASATLARAADRLKPAKAAAKAGGAKGGAAKALTKVAAKPIAKRKKGAVKKKLVKKLVKVTRRVRVRVSLMGGDVATLPRAQQLQLLAALRRRLRHVALRLHARRAGLPEPDPEAVQPAAAAAAPPPPQPDAAVEAPAKSGTKRKARGGGAAESGKAARGKRRAARSDGSDSDDAGDGDGDDDFVAARKPAAKPRARRAARDSASAGGEAGAGAAATVAASPILLDVTNSRASDVAMLVSMGFDGRKGEEALNETGGDVEAAVAWLFENCT